MSRFMAQAAAHSLFHGASCAPDIFFLVGFQQHSAQTGFACKLLQFWAFPHPAYTISAHSYKAFWSVNGL